MFLTGEQQMLRKAVREYVEKEVAPHAAEWDEADICPVECFAEMGQLGVIGVFVPEELGGVGCGYLERAICLEEISRHSAGLGIAVMTHHLGLSAILDSGSEEQKRKYIPQLATGEKICGLSVTEPGGGSDFMGQVSTAERHGNDWLINGRKCFITNSHISDVDIWTVRSGVNEKGRPELTAFIIEKDTPGHKAGRKEKKIGLRGSVTGEIICDNVCLPDSAVLGAVGSGAKIGMSAISEVGRSGMAAICLGIIRGCLEEGIKFANERIIYGKPLAKLQSAQFIIGEVRTAYEAARLMVYHAAELKDRGEPCATEIAMAKLFASEEAVKAAKNVMDLMGAYGCINEYPIGRFLRDALAAIPSGGTSHIHKLVVSGAALKESL
ncbi:MAG: acyl-CoA dehydrogenase family protein [Bacillota bacterium]|nr:acyl-CoA dehydrogenase family protein [Bacillota bacterium]